MSTWAESRESLERSSAIREALEGLLGASFRIKEIRRRPSLYRTSFPIEELDVECEGGVCFPMMLKVLNRQSLSEEAQRAKPDFLHDPLREIEVYQTILATAQLGTPQCYGASTDGSSGRCWLFLERVVGRELNQVGEFDVWQQVARWLAGLHALFDPARTPLKQATHLIEYDGAFYRLWLPRALSWTRDRQARRQTQWLADRYETVVERLLALPTTFLHGEFYASNVLVADVAAGLRVCPVDWEMAARGPGLIDLAALTAGKWSDHERTALALAYRGAREGYGLPTPAPQDFLVELACCRLQLAVQWLGWSPDWSPPPEHDHDWLSEALELAEKLSL